MISLPTIQFVVFTKVLHDINVVNKGVGFTLHPKVTLYFARCVNMCVNMCDVHSSQLMSI